MESMEDLSKIYSELIERNIKEKDGFQYTVPSSSTYPYQWLWDSCFHAIIYTHFSIEDAKKEILSLLGGQWENGMLPHIIHWEKPQEGQHKKNWGTEKNSSSITQPPMIAYAVERIYDKEQDKSFVEDIFDKLHAFYKWVNDERTQEGELIPSIVHPWESGEDDLVVFDAIYGLENPTKEQIDQKKDELLNKYVKNQLNAREFWKESDFKPKSLLFSSVYLKNLKSMLKLSKICGRMSVYYEELIPKVEKEFKEKLFDEDQQIYSTCYSKGNLTDVRAAEMFLPLFAGVATQEEAERLVDKFLMDKNRFWLEYPVPSISKANPMFSPNAYWRGSTWINLNWFIVKGLEDYGFKEIAEELKEKTISLIKKSNFREYYNPNTGEGLGPEDFMWSGLVFDL